MPTIQFGNQALPPQELRADKKAARKIGPLGMGRRALYLNSFYISRMYYVLWTDIRRVYKLVAMSKGGFTGIGAFGSMSYLVVELRDGRLKKCQIKYENQNDQAIAWIAEHHPEIPTRSEAAQKKLDEKLQKELSKPKVSPDGGTEQSIRILQDAQRYLEERPDLYRALSSRAGTKRVQQMVSPGRRVVGTAIFVVSILLLAAGIPLAIKANPAGIYMALFGAAFLLFSLAGNLVPIGRNSPRGIERAWPNGVSSREAYIAQWSPSADAGGDSSERMEGFPVPARYAHPVVLERMIRVLEEGRAKDPRQALEVVKSDLKSLNRSVKVSQEEYDEVVAVKPMFLVSEYR